MAKEEQPSPEEFFDLTEAEVTELVAEAFSGAPQEEQDAIATAIIEFLSEIEKLVEDYGEEETQRSLQAVAPKLADASFLEDSRGFVVNEAWPLATGLANVALGGGKVLGKVWGGIKKLLGFAGKKKGKVKAPGKLGGARGLMGAGGAAAFGKGWDQDVNIADITTTKTLPVDAPDLEKLMGNTNATLKDLQKTLSQTQDMLIKKLDDLDISVDTWTAASTGADPASIDAAQSAGVGPEQAAKPKRKRKYTAPQRMAWNPLGGVLDKLYDVERTGEKESFLNKAVKKAPGKPKK